MPLPFVAVAGAIIQRFSFRTWAWMAGVGGLAIVLIVIWLQFGGHVKTWWGGYGRTEKKIERAIEESVRVEKDVAQKDEAIRRLAQEIAVARALAAKEKARADDLAGRVAQLESARRAQPRVRTLTEARDALNALYRR